MSVSVRFHVLSTTQIQPGDLPVVVTLYHFGDSKEVVRQCFGEDRSIKSRKLPESSWLYDTDSDAVTTHKQVGSGGEPLRYTTAKQVAKLLMPDWVGPFDHAMMAYFKQLASEQPETIVVLERF